MLARHLCSQLAKESGQVEDRGSEDMSEIKQLLCEIRDLLKANYEMTKEFRQAALARQQASDERIKLAREEERCFREELSKEVHETGKRSPWAFWSYVATLLVLVACAVLLIVFSSGRR
jgi:hypothetical protein